MPNAYIVYNPTAGRFPSQLLTERAAKVLQEHDWQVQLVRTTGGPHITQTARRAVQEGVDAFFIAGGDGSVNYAVCGLYGSDTALGVLPAGTANVWAKELGQPGLTWTRWLALEESAENLASISVRSVDIGFCNDHPFLLWAGVGLDAFIVHSVEPRSRFEKYFAIAPYAARVLRHAVSWKGINLHIQADGTEVNGRYLLAVVSNIHLYAGGLTEISPDARLDDGIMDLWLFEGETFLDTMTVARDLLSGNHVQSSRARCIPFKFLQISSNDPPHVQLDGEPVIGETHMSIEVRKQALKILVSKTAPQHLFEEKTA